MGGIRNVSGPTIGQHQGHATNRSRRAVPAICNSAMADPLPTIFTTALRRYGVAADHDAVRQPMESDS